MDPKNMTLKELMEQLSRIEETQLVELLGLTSEDLVRNFKDRIVENSDYLVSEIEMPFVPLEDNEYEEYDENEIHIYDPEDDVDYDPEDYDHEYEDNEYGEEDDDF